MKRVHFIGSGYESVKWVYVNAETTGEAIDKALQWYKDTNQTFSYVEMECEKYEYKDVAEADVIDYDYREDLDER